MSRVHDLEREVATQRKTNEALARSLERYRRALTHIRDGLEPGTHGAFDFGAQLAGVREYAERVLKGEVAPAPEGVDATSAEDSDG